MLQLTGTRRQRNQSSARTSLLVVLFYPTPAADASRRLLAISIIRHHRHGQPRLHAIGRFGTLSKDRPSSAIIGK